VILQEKVVSYMLTRSRRGLRTRGVSIGGRALRKRLGGGLQVNGKENWEGRKVVGSFRTEKKTVYALASGVVRLGQTGRGGGRKGGGRGETGIKCAPPSQHSQAWEGLLRQRRRI